MVRQEARFHMTMLLSQYSHGVANLFTNKFEHEERVRSSNRVEMQEINEFWEKELKAISPKASRNAIRVSTENGIDAWLSDFGENVLPDIIFRWGK
ncbi:hypothetical protein MOC16_gp072 [Klebsiella phage vB_KpM_FBKp24]|uniref:Uncharacterized protein n=1 Tax=Klebsiella phage vB_KpM_FBKp24 TaxID=2801834 RepID=A0A7U0J5J2_9CAUD|nr:hypothetical protein [Klebsiella pneumoniae]YP_010298978.1 hypothetical protein MOC16_gp072 [Klebsiella phage vB_KpM_FBKp24]QQV92308.1 hypothetical protein vBKpMFBKp24_341 [Klebsiella phage vB_KpM_FBKp24]